MNSTLGSVVPLAMFRFIWLINWLKVRRGALSSLHLHTAVVQSTKDCLLICSKTQNKAVTEKTPSLQRSFSILSENRSKCFVVTVVDSLLQVLWSSKCLSEGTLWPIASCSLPIQPPPVEKYDDDGDNGDHAKKINDCTGKNLGSFRILRTYFGKVEENPIQSCFFSSDLP